MQVQVKARYLRHTPDKIRPIARLYVGKKLQVALKELPYIHKAPANDLYKLAKSAESAAKAKEFNLSEAQITKFFCDEGPKLKRRIPRSKGRISPFQKRLSHVTLVVEEIQKKETGKDENGTKS